MDVSDAINARRAYRSLLATPITPELIDDLARYAGLSASCFNNQPWRFVFVFDETVLKSMFEALPRGNVWATAASMIIAVCAKKDDDCLIKGREYYLFDAGMATAFLILRATELGLVAHPIGGYDEEKAKIALGVPEDMTVITLVIVGKHSSEINDLLSEQQAADEKNRPERLPLPGFAYINGYGKR